MDPTLNPTHSLSLDGMLDVSRAMLDVSCQRAPSVVCGDGNSARLSRFAARCPLRRNFGGYARSCGSLGRISSPATMTSSAGECFASRCICKQEPVEGADGFQETCTYLNFGGLPFAGMGSSMISIFDFPALCSLLHCYFNDVR